MKLIPRRKKKPSAFEQTVEIARIAVKGLMAQRMLRGGLRTYRFTRRAVPIAGLAALGAVVARKLGGGGGRGAPSTSAPAVSEALADAGVEGSGPDTPKEAAGPGTEEALDVEAPNQSTPPPPEKASKAS